MYQTMAAGFLPDLRLDRLEEGLGLLAPIKVAKSDAPSSDGFTLRLSLLYWRANPILQIFVLVGPKQTGASPTEA
jgi:hypothetical protein